MFRPVLIALLIMILFSGCRSLLTKKYKFNREFNFKTREEYLHYLAAERKFDLSHVLYPDSNSQSHFFYYISKNKLTEYYGSLINDSTEIRKSLSLQDNLNCMGRILTEIQNNINTVSIDDSMYIRNDFYRFRFRHITNGEKFNFYSSDKPLKIFLIHSYSYGTYFDSFLNAMNEFSIAHNNEAEVYIISLDYGFRFK